MEIHQHKRALVWAKDKVKINSEFEPVRLMPWSSVYRASTKDGWIFLKAVSPPFDVELKLLPYLSEQFPEAVPHVIASNPELFCILMLDAGTPLRPIMQKNYQTNLALEALKTYVHIQQNLSEKTETLLKLGVPDWRLNTLSSHFSSLLEKEKFLIGDGLLAAEIEKLRAMHDKVQNLCEKLASFAIPETIEHGDMQDNNILVNTQNKLVIHDWGDAVITHPFFSLCNFLHSAVNQHDIKQEVPILEQAYCDTWSKHDTKEHLKDVLFLTKQLRELKFALSFSRIAECHGMHDLGEYKGTVAYALKAFIQRVCHA